MSRSATVASILLVGLMLQGCTTRQKVEYYLAAAEVPIHDPAKARPRVRFYRVKIEGRSANSTASLMTGFYPARALHSLFGQVESKAESKKKSSRTESSEQSVCTPDGTHTTRMERRIEWYMIGKDGSAQPIGEDERLTILYGANASALAQQVKLFADSERDGKYIGRLLANALAGDSIREALAVSSQARSEQGKTAKIKEAIEAKLEPDAGAKLGRFTPTDNGGRTATVALNGRYSGPEDTALILRVIEKGGAKAWRVTSTAAKKALTSSDLKKLGLEVGDVPAALEAGDTFVVRCEAAKVIGKVQGAGGPRLLTDGASYTGDKDMDAHPLQFTRRKDGAILLGDQLIEEGVPFSIADPPVRGLALRNLVAAKADFRAELGLTPSRTGALVPSSATATVEVKATKSGAKKARTYELIVVGATPVTVAALDADDGKVLSTTELTGDVRKLAFDGNEAELTVADLSSVTLGMRWVVSGTLSDVSKKQLDDRLREQARALLTALGVSADNLELDKLNDRIPSE